MTPIINSSFNKYPMSWELIHSHLLHYFDSVIKLMRHNHTLTGLPKHFPKNINQAPCATCYTENMTTLPKVKTVFRTNLQPG